MEQWRTGNKAFYADVVAAAATLPTETAKIRHFGSSGNLVTNDWKENPNGEGYREGARAAGRSDVLEWAKDVLAPRVQAVFDDFSQRYDWGDPGSIRFQRAAGEHESAGQGGRRAAGQRVDHQAVTYGTSRAGPVSVDAMAKLIAKASTLVANRESMAEIGPLTGEHKAALTKLLGEPKTNVTRDTFGN